MLGIYRLLFVCLSVHNIETATANERAVTPRPCHAVTLELPPATNTWAVTAIGMRGNAPVWITGALVYVYFSYHVLVTYADNCISLVQCMFELYWYHFV